MSPSFFSSPFGQYAVLAALMLVCAFSSIYVWSVHNNQVRLEAELATERQRSERLRAGTRGVQGALIVWTFVSDHLRAVGDIAEVESVSTTQRIMVELALEHAASGPYHVRLEKAGTLIWSASLLPLVSPSGDARLVFDLPAKLMEANNYNFIVSSGGGAPSTYRFRVRTTP